MGQGHSSPETEEKESTQRQSKWIFKSARQAGPEATNRVEVVTESDMATTLLMVNERPTLLFYKVSNELFFTTVTWWPTIVSQGCDQSEVSSVFSSTHRPFTWFGPKLWEIQKSSFNIKLPFSRIISFCNTVYTWLPCCNQLRLQLKTDDDI